MEMAEGAIENLGMFNILKTFVFAGPNAKKTRERCQFFNAPKNFEASCFAKNYVNPTDRVIEELQKYDEQYHEECDNTDEIIKMYPKFIFLVSQGGEDYFFSPREPVVKGEDKLLLEEKVKIVSKFKDHCATKEQLAVVRKILSRVKAGGIINYIKVCVLFGCPKTFIFFRMDIAMDSTCPSPWTTRWQTSRAVQQYSRNMLKKKVQ